MTQNEELPVEFRVRLLEKKKELDARLERINANVRRPLDTDSKERAKELEDQEVVDALGNEAREELRKINDALKRMAAGTFGRCLTCGQQIDKDRLLAYSYAEECIDCATRDELNQLNR